MAKKVIDFIASPPLSSPGSSKTRKLPKMKASTSSKKTQLKKKKCAQRSKPPKPNLNYNTKDLLGHAYSIQEVPHRAQAVAAECESDIARPKTSIPQQGINRLKPLIPKEPLQMGRFVCKMPPPHFESYALNSSRQLLAPYRYNNSTSSAAHASYYSNYAANYFNQLSSPCLYNFKNNLTFPGSYYSNYMIMEDMSPPQTLTPFPAANVNNNTNAWKERFVKKKVDSDASAVASNGEVDLELRL